VTALALASGAVAGAPMCEPNGALGERRAALGVLLVGQTNGRGGCGWRDCGAAAAAARAAVLPATGGGVLRRTGAGFAYGDVSGSRGVTAAVEASAAACAADEAIARAPDTLAGESDDETGAGTSGAVPDAAGRTPGALSGESGGAT
jgi:hypothetical protein